MKLPPRIQMNDSYPNELNQKKPRKIKVNRANLLFRYDYLTIRKLKNQSASGKKLARKGVEGARSVHGALRRGEPVAMLIDQKHSRGLPLPFFGRPALTGTAPAELSLKYAAPIIPVQLERLNGAHFRLTVHEPLATPHGLSETETVTKILTQLNALLESWTREHPEQWLWLHRRWG